MNTQDKCTLEQLIVSNVCRRGDGRYTPIRVVKQVFTTDGSLIAEYDPCSLSIEQIQEVLAKNGHAALLPLFTSIITE